MILNGEGLIVGRVASFVAKRALQGERIDIVNCEKMVITGSKDDVLTRFKTKVERGDPYHGPFYPKMPDRIVRRAIRGMLPYKEDRGKKAYKRVRCHIGIPAQLKSKKIETLEFASIKNLKTSNYVYVSEISRYLGKNV